jgi:hypothetical protein
MEKNKFIEGLLALWGEDMASDNGRARETTQREPEIFRRLASRAIFREMMQHAESLTALSSTEEESLHVDDERLREFVDDKLSSEEAEPIKAHLRACIACFIRMARLQKKLKEDAELRHAKAPAGLAAKARFVDIPDSATMELPGRGSSRKENVWHTVRQFPQQFNSILAEVLVPISESMKTWFVAHPRFGFGAVGLVAAAILLMLLLPRAPIKNDPLSGQLVISDAGPLGFVNAQEVIDYPGMSVGLSTNGDSLIFSWPAIPNALAYEITLLEGGKDKKLPFRVKVEATNFSLPKAEFKVGVKYVWELSGKLRDGRVFVARAAFVRRE